MSGAECLASICVLLLLVGFALIWRAVSRSPRPGRPTRLPYDFDGGAVVGWRFVVAGSCVTGPCDCREFAGLVIEHDGALPPRHGGCTCYFEAPG
jgi:hypothetical protein